MREDQMDTLHEENEGSLNQTTDASEETGTGGSKESPKTDSKKSISWFHGKLPVLICILVAVLATVFIGVFLLRELRSQNRMDLQALSIRASQICNKQECLRSAASLKLSMNLSVDPCENFYKFSCGRWSQEHPHSTLSSLETSKQRMEEKILDFLQNNSSEDDPLPIVQSRDFFKSCMNTEAREKKRFSVALKYLRLANLPLVPHFLKKSKPSGFAFDWMRTEVAIKTVFYMDVFFGVTIDEDVDGTSNHSIYLGSPRLDYPLSNTFRRNRIESIGENGPEDSKQQEAEIFKYVVESILVDQLVPVPKEAVLDKAYQVIYNIAERIDSYWNTYLKKFTGNDAFISMTLNELQNLTDEYLTEKWRTPLRWEDYFRILLEDSKINTSFDGSEPVFMRNYHMEQFQKIAAYLLELPDDYLELYMWWVTLYPMMTSTTCEMTEYISGELSCSTPSHLRSLECAKRVTKFMGMAVSYGVFDRGLFNQTRLRVQVMLKEMKEAVVHTAEIEKIILKDMETFIGYTEWLYVPGWLEEHYQGISIKNDTYLDNIMEFVTKYLPNELKKIDVKNDTSVFVGNAYHYYSEKSTGIKTPFWIPLTTVPPCRFSYGSVFISTRRFRLGVRALNYGAVGIDLGRDLASDKSLGIFNIQCSIKPYNNFTVLWRRLDPTDSFGFYFAYRAYKSQQSGRAPEPPLPGFEGYSEDQMFFIAFANTFCNASTVEAQLLNMVRVLVPLQHLPEFAEAFKCSKGSKMNPSSKPCWLVID